MQESDRYKDVSANIVTLNTRKTSVQYRTLFRIVTMNIIMSAIRPVHLFADIYNTPLQAIHNAVNLLFDTNKES